MDGSLSRFVLVAFTSSDRLRLDATHTAGLRSVGDRREPGARAAVRPDGYVLDFDSVLTIFSIPKPFDSASAEPQRRAIASWKNLDRDAQIILVGAESGVDAEAAMIGVQHVSEVACSATGTPRIDDAFRQIDRIARHPLRCFVNADIILGHDLITAASVVTRSSRRFLLVGQTRDVEPACLSDLDLSAMQRVVLDRGVLRGAAAIDWFVFPAGLFDPIPPFLVGRAAFDNWMIWKARQLGPVIDATDAVVAIHQSHGYDHLAGGKGEAYYGAEAARNLELAGGTGRRYTLHDASHRLRADLSIHRNPGSILRVRETVRKVGWKLGMR